MTETAHRASHRDPRCQDVLARLVAVEEALRSLERDVRAIGREPHGRVGRAESPASWPHGRTYGHQDDMLVMEVSA